MYFGGLEIWPSKVESYDTWSYLLKAFFSGGLTTINAFFYLLANGHTYHTDHIDHTNPFWPGGRDWPGRSYWPLTWIRCRDANASRKGGFAKTFGEAGKQQIWYLWNCLDEENMAAAPCSLESWELIWNIQSWPVSHFSTFECLNVQDTAALATWGKRQKNSSKSKCEQCHGPKDICLAWRSSDMQSLNLRKTCLR